MRFSLLILHVLPAAFLACELPNLQDDAGPNQKPSKYCRHQNDSRALQVDDVRNTRALTRSRGKQARIVNGHDSARGRFNYQAALGNIHDSLDNFKFHCSGTLIAPDVILTAAHCVTDHIGAQMGRHNITDATEEFTEKKSVDTRSHPLHNYPNTDSHDVALLMFDSIFEGYPVVKLNRAARGTTPTEEEKLTVLGWGAVHDSGGFPDVKQEVVVYYQKTCGRYFPSWISDDMLCAGGHGGSTDSCYGDSGGPLVRAGLNPEDDIQVGVVSWGLACASDKYPGVYAELSNPSIYEWITEQVCDFSTQPPSEFDCDNLRVKPDEITCVNGDTARKRQCVKATSEKCSKVRYFDKCCKSCAKYRPSSPET